MSGTMLDMEARASLIDSKTQAYSIVVHDIKGHGVADNYWGIIQDAGMNLFLLNLSASQPHAAVSGQLLSWSL